MSDNAAVHKVSSSALDIDSGLVQHFHGAPEQLSPENGAGSLPADYNREPLSRSQSVVQRIQTSYSFFNEKLKSQRKSLLYQTIQNYTVIGVLVLAIFSIYWGSNFQRSTRYKDLRMLVVIDDDEVVNGTQPAIGDAMREFLSSPKALAYGGWEIQNMSEFRQLAASNGHDVEAEIIRQIHHQRYWLSIYVKANATYNLKQAIINGDTSYNVSYNSMLSYYETGRDLMAMNTYVTLNVQKINSEFLRKQHNISEVMFRDEDVGLIFTNIRSVQVASTPLDMTFIDMRPVTNSVLVAPSQVGFIYMIIVTFFAFNFFADVHKGVAALGVKQTQLVLYRVLSAVVGFFFISFFFSLVTLAFQVDFTAAFGKSGWLVYWSTNFLTMWAVGAMNEAMAMVCIMLYPPLVGFWMLFWVILNISATFAPIALTPHFYRYTYAMPIHAAYEITKVVLFDTYKGAMGRNYAILIIWIVIATVSLVFSFIVFSRVMGKRAKAERAKIESEIIAKHTKELGDQIQFD